MVRLTSIFLLPSPAALAASAACQRGVEIPEPFVPKEVVDYAKKIIAQ